MAEENTDPQSRSSSRSSMDRSGGWDRGLVFAALATGVVVGIGVVIGGSIVRLGGFPAYAAILFAILVSTIYLWLDR